MGERIRRFAAIGAILAGFVVAVFVVYSAATRRNPNAAPRRDASGRELFPTAGTRGSSDAPAPSSMPGFQAGTGLIPSIPGAEPARVSGQAQGGAARSSVFGIAPAAPQSVAEDEGGPVTQAAAKLSPAPLPPRQAPTLDAAASRPEAAQSSGPEPPKVGHVHYGNRNRRRLMIRARGPVLNPKDGSAPMAAPTAATGPKTFQTAPSASLQTVAGQLDQAGQALQATPAAAAIGSDTIAAIEAAKKQLRGEK